MEIIPEARPLHALGILIGMVVGIRAEPSSRRSTAGWTLAALSATTYAALVVRDRRRKVQWWVEHSDLAD